MNSSIKPLIVSLASMVILSACTTPIPFFPNAPTAIYYKDGRAAYVTTCKAVNWGYCLEKAGMVCKSAGYTVLEKNSNRNHGEEEKELVFACNDKPSAVAN